jgi:uncharacterized protein (TIGR03435 family)
MLPVLKSSFFFSLFASAVIASAQLSAPQMDSGSTMPAFDVVSIRQIESGQIVRTTNGIAAVGARVKPCEYLRDRIMCQLSLQRLMEEAFQLKDYEIAGPDWLAKDIYVVQATMPLDTNKDTARLMLQQALEDRFSIKVHHEKNELPVYELLPGKHGIKLQPADDPAHQKLLDNPSFPGHGATVSMTAGHFFAVGITPDLLAIYLRTFGGVGLPVINKTGLTGEYKIDMHWEPADDPNSFGKAEDRGFPDAVKSQLGLELKKSTDPIDMLVIDHIERTPSEN